MADFKYIDYLMVKEDFIPVFTEDVDRGNRSSWKSFIPHEQMRELLEKLISALDREKKDDIKSFWLNGAYGTGKTFASFVVKHILEDDLEEVEEYFNQYSSIKHLWPRFANLRRQKGRYVVVYRSGSGHIGSDRRLIIEMQYSIIKRMQELEYDTFVPGIIEQIVDKLYENPVISWEGIFDKYRDRFRMFASAEELLKALQKKDIEAGEIVAGIMEEEGIALLDSPEEMKRWLKEVIDKNKLAGIIFIWDEFSEFFSRNRNLTTLQELAQATYAMPFYLFLITHRALSHFIPGDDEGALRKLQDRFHNQRLEMKEVTAYTLLGNAIFARPEKEKVWQAKLGTIWDKRVERLYAHLNLVAKDNVNINELKKLVPIHPYAAYLLSHISGLYNSSQRTLFSFLKSEEKGGFQWFIKEDIKEGFYWLTADYLWDYFFEAQFDNMEMSEALTYVVSYYEGVKERVKNEEERKVLKVILLLIALSRQQGPAANSMQKPEFSTLKIAFAGTLLGDEHNLEKAIEKLEKERIILVSSYEGKKEFLLPGSRIDEEILKESRQYVDGNVEFEKLLKDGDGLAVEALKSLFPLEGALQKRLRLGMLSADELRKKSVQALNIGTKPYEVAVYLVVGKKEDDLYLLDELPDKVKEHSQSIIMVSQNPLGERRFVDLKEHMVYKRAYERMGENAQAQYHSKKIEEIIDRWKEEIRNGHLAVFYGGKKYACNGANSAIEKVRDIIQAEIFYYGPENIPAANTMYSRGGSRPAAEIGLGIKEARQNPEKEVVNTLERAGLWSEKNLSSLNINHPLVEMQKELDKFFVQNNGRIRLLELWERLKEPPFGLMESQMGMLIFARLMRKYIEGFYLFEGANSVPLNPDKMASILPEIIKETRNAENYFICRVSKEGEDFCQLARIMFNLPDYKALYPEVARKNMREIVKKLGYPVWSVYYAVKGHQSEGFKEALSCLHQVLCYDQEELRDEEMRHFKEKVEPYMKGISSYLQEEHMRKGMEEFYLQSEPGLCDYKESRYMGYVHQRLKKMLEEDVYLWREERVKSKLPEVVSEIKLIELTKMLTGQELTDINGVADALQKSFRRKLPWFSYKRITNDGLVKEALDLLEEALKDSQQAARKANAERFKNKAYEIKRLLEDNEALVLELAQQYTSQEISPEDAKEIYRLLPDLFTATEERVKQELEKALDSLSRRKAVKILEETWEGLTGTLSPEEWSRNRQIPIHWVLGDSDFLDFYDKYAVRQNLPEEELQGMVGFLKSREESLQVLQDRDSLLDRFAEAAAGEYKDLLVGNRELIEELHKYLAARMGNNVSQWIIQHAQINKLVREWINENYRRVFQPRVEEVINRLSQEELKRFIKEKAVEDSLLGMRILLAFNR